MSRPIDYSLGKTLDEVMRRRTNFSSLMELEANQIEQGMFPTYPGPKTASIHISRNHNLRRPKDVEHFIRNHPKELGSSFRLPPIESVTPNQIEILVSRHDDTLIHREKNSVRIPPEDFPIGKRSSLPSSGASPLGRSPPLEATEEPSYSNHVCLPSPFEKLPIYNLVDTSSHKAPLLAFSMSDVVSEEKSRSLCVKTVHQPESNKDNLSMRDEAVILEDFSLAKAYPSSSIGSKKDNQQKADDANLNSAGFSVVSEKRATSGLDWHQRESSENEILSYISSSSSTDNAPLSLAEDRLRCKEEFPEKSNRHKPPIPPRAKHDLSDVDVVFSELKSKHILPSMVPHNRIYEANNSKTSQDEKLKSSSFVDDENVSMTSDLKFAYSPVSSASFHTSDDIRSTCKEQPLGLPSSTVAALSTQSSVQELPVCEGTAEVGSVALEKERYRSIHDDRDESLLLPVAGVLRDQFLIADTVSSVDSDLKVRSKSASPCNDIDIVSDGIGTTLVDDAITIVVPEKGVPHICEEISSFVSSLSLQPTSEDLSQQFTPSPVDRDETDCISDGVTVDPSSASSDCSEESGENHRGHDSGILDKEPEISENVFIGLYQDIVYLISHGNKQQDEGQSCKPKEFDDLVSEQDSGASDASYDIENEELKEERMFCSICGGYSNEETFEEAKLEVSHESSYFSKSPREPQDNEPRDEFIENPERLDHTSCPEKSDQETVITDRRILDEAIIDKANADESDDSCDVERGKHFLTARDNDGAVPVKNPWEASRNRCSHPVQEKNHPRAWFPYEDEHYHPRESLFLRVRRRRAEVRPTTIRSVMLEDFFASQIACGDGNTEIPNKGSGDVDEVHHVIQSIQQRIDDGYAVSLAPELARGFDSSSRNDAKLPNFDKYMEGFEDQLERFRQGMKDILLTESKATVSTTIVHLQPVQGLGESYNQFIDLPVKRLPKLSLTAEACDCTLELKVATAIINEELSYTARRVNACVRLCESRNQLVDSKDPGGVFCATTLPTRKQYDAIEEPQLASHVGMGQVPELLSRSKQQQHSVFPWFHSLQKTRSDPIVLMEFEDYLNQPTATVDSKWQDIPVPNIDDLLEQYSIPEANPSQSSKAQGLVSTCITHVDIRDNGDSMMQLKRTEYDRGRLHPVTSPSSGDSSGVTTGEWAAALWNDTCSPLKQAIMTVMDYEGTIVNHPSDDKSIARITPMSSIDLIDLRTFDESILEGE